MDEICYLNIAETSEDVSTSLTYAFMDMRAEFQKWLADGNTRNYSPEVVLTCMDKISDYAIRTKMVARNLWEYVHPLAFSLVYHKLLGARLYRVIDRKTYKVFIKAGQLYLRFLKEKPFAHNEKGIAVAESEEEKANLKPIQATINIIDPEDVIAWLITQPNANGTLYLENVVRQYMSALRTAPAKLDIPVVMDVRNAFACHTPDDLNAYWEIFQAAPNYKQVNSNTSGMFSAGMSCLLRYLQHLSKSTSNVEKIDKPDVIQLIESLGLEYVDKRNSGGVLWVIGGSELTPVMMKLRESGLYFRFKEGGGRSSGYRDAWWCKPEDLQPSHVVSTISSNFALDPAVILKLTDVLSSHFANGFRLNSPIELVRFRSFVAEDLGMEISLSDEELKRYISACGTNYDGKIYAVSTKTKEQIKELVESYFADGAKAIFFAEFYAKNENWLFGANIVSENMLIDILREQFPELSFTHTYFGYTNVSVFAVLESEILRVWGTDLLLTYYQIAERLPYIPLERIKYALGQNGDFIWNSVETFSHISRIVITEEEREVIRATAIRECNIRGYVSITDLPYSDIEERYYELSITAIHNAVYRICLSDKFDKKGKIVTRKGDVFDALTIMKDYCRSIDKCTLEDLLNYEKELTGEIHRWIPMEAGNTVLVRLDKDTYVADRYVNFNIELIDEAIELTVRGDYLPLKSFTTFGAFPDCGHTWNLFLLESYCRRFSRKFRFDAPSVNSRNAGAVIRKSCAMNYTEIMADAVLRANIPLKEATVGRFLYDSGYTGRGTTAKAPEIIDICKYLREMRD